MQSKSDAELLHEYVKRASDGAFQEIVTRHAGLIYASALRQVGSPDLAKDVAQEAFTALARKAASIDGRMANNSLVGWLYRSTRFAALTVLRAQRRRLAHERQAMEHVAPASEESGEPVDWQRVSKVLDEAMSDLSEQDRDAILLRFFENQDLRSVGIALGLSADTAQKRVSRALERLRAHLNRRRVTTSEVALSGALVAKAAPAAPTGLTANLCAGALAGTSLITAVATATQTLAMTTLQKTLIAAAVAVAVGTTVFQAHKNSELRKKITTLEQQLAQAAEQVASREPTAGGTEQPVASEQPALIASSSTVSETNIDWASRLLALNTNDWRSAFAVGQQLAALAPNVGFEILQAHWTAVTNISARQQLLKAFDFAQHERLPAALYLALTDPSAEVQSWALTYLKEVALQDFSSDYRAGLDWLAARRELPLSEAFADAVRHAADTLLTADPTEVRARLVLLGRATGLLSKFPTALGGTNLEATFAQLANVVDEKTIEALFQSAAGLHFGDAWYREVALPRLSSGYPLGVRDAAARALADPKREWAVQPLLEALTDAAVTEPKPRVAVFSLADALGRMASSKTIPAMIALIEAENTYDTVYGIGYFGLSKMTGVSYDEKHDGRWWRQWWEQNKQRFPADVQAMEIPRIEPVKKIGSAQ